jgi:hypothetical protein
VLNFIFEPLFLHVPSLIKCGTDRKYTETNNNVYISSIWGQTNYLFEEDPEDLTIAQSTRGKSTGIKYGGWGEYGKKKYGQKVREIRREKEGEKSCDFR